jgi:hypothetical protein
MEQVNSASRSRIDALRALTNKYVPYPDKFNGSYSGGIQISYYLENNYHLVAGTYYFKESNTFGYRQGSGTNSLQFQNDRINELFEINLGIKYFLRYRSWSRVNFYFTGTAGFAFGWAESVFIYLDDVNSVDNKGDFSSSAITGYFCTGISFRISSVLSLEPELGYRFANLGQMDGTLRLAQNFNNDPNLLINTTDSNYRTEANYDFSGFYLNLGLNFQISILD